MEKSKRSFLPWGMVSTILTLAWPTMLEELMQTAVQYIDTAMVGAIGTQATAAVGATSTVNWLIGSTVDRAPLPPLAWAFCPSCLRPAGRGIRNGRGKPRLRRYWRFWSAARFLLC